MNIKQLSLVSLVLGLFSLTSTIVAAQDKLDTKEIHFLIPGGPGGGWDGTARGTGEALMKSGKIDHASYQNMSGGGGGKAIAYMIETAEKQKNTLMVNSTPIVVRSLTGVFPQSFRDLKPVAGTIADFGAFVVRKDSKYTDWRDVLVDFRTNPRKVKFSGGSARGSLDHLVAAMAVKAGGAKANRMVYVAYDGGGKAMAGLLSGETSILSTGVGEALTMAQSGEVRILAITSKDRLTVSPKTPTLIEMGYDVVFANWRGFFASPEMPDAKVEAYAKLLGDVQNTPSWNEIKDRNGWVNLYNSNSEFYAFLENQEKEIGVLMRELGFLK
jgi:putative tricarboxylic transport membrane protein